ncbi:4'-phosphopantetheinyl transferase family protein [Xylophilus ampelinus]|uniref:Enterobactin synthase component D n=1 Tax=Xylophilus ampelinus TaxID=54067 RepID=A0A318SCW1_9BURK|nr:4'-phosphopantetheinyl transferase superfamily protein [Xylophilus ampelinus]MCS4511910.1 4'-phosphopantetheinyl transferase superfamily protein [Xylophilus ampelinus]PYE72987.1 4'-phosphopantetheinyl transferase EntD [Xylophilus ampelinus]
METLLSVRELKLPSGGLLQVFLASFDSSRFEQSAFAAAGIPCPASVARSVRKRQAEFFFGRLVARAALCDCGAPIVDVPIGNAGEPVWPEHFVGSISHTNAVAVAVVGEQAYHVGLGIDIERVVSPESEIALRAIAINPDELDFLRSVDGPLELRELVTLVFSAKESLYKGAFSTVQRFFDFHAARVSAIDVACGVVTLTLEEDLNVLFPRKRRCEIGYVQIDPMTILTVFEAREKVELSGL